MSIGREIGLVRTITSTESIPAIMLAAWICMYSIPVRVSAQPVTDSISPESDSDFFQLRGYIKNMETMQMANLRYIAHGNLIHNRLNARLYPTKNSTLGLEIRNRIFTGDMVQYNPAFAPTVNTDNGLINLSFLWLDEGAVAGLTQIDRLWYRFTTDKWDMTIGRQRINWGLNMFWNSNDLFNTFNLADFDYEERPGTDAVRIQRHFKNMQSMEFAVAPSLNDSTWVAAGLYKFNKWSYDFQLLAGWWNKDIAVGAGWAGNVKGGSFKGEATYFHPATEGTDTTGTLSVSVSIDYVFKGSAYLMGRLLFNSLGTSSSAFSLFPGGMALGTNEEPPSAKNLMPTKYTAMLSFGRPLTPLISANMVALYAPGPHLLFAMPSLSFSIASNWDFSLFGQTVLLDNGSVFRNYGTGIFARLKWGF